MLGYSFWWSDRSRNNMSGRGGAISVFTFVSILPRRRLLRTRHRRLGSFEDPSYFRVSFRVPLARIRWILLLYILRNKLWIIYILMCVLMDRSVSAILGVIGDVHVSGTIFFSCRARVLLSSCGGVISPTRSFRYGGVRKGADSNTRFVFPSIDARFDKEVLFFRGDRLTITFSTRMFCTPLQSKKRSRWLGVRPEMYYIE